LEHERRAGRAATLVHDRLVLDTLELTETLLDRALLVVLGHVGRARGQQRRTQARVAFRVAAAELGGDHDLAGDLGEDLAARGIGGALLALDRGPFAVSRHEAWNTTARVFGCIVSSSGRWAVRVGDGPPEIASSGSARV